MNGAGNNKKTGYLVIALLLVGLTAYSNAVKELTEIHRLTMGASDLIAQWSQKTVPAEIPQIPQTVIKLDACESRQLERMAEVLPVPEVPEVIEPDVATPEKGTRPRVRGKASTDQLAKIKKATRVEFGAADFAFQMSTDQLPDAAEPLVVEFPASAFKAKARKHFFKFNPRDREILLKTLNRNINLRTAG